MLGLLLFVDGEGKEREEKQPRNWKVRRFEGEEGVLRGGEVVVVVDCEFCEEVGVVSLVEISDRDGIVLVEVVDAGWEFVPVCWLEVGGFA